MKLDEAPQGGAIFVGTEGKIMVACGVVTEAPADVGVVCVCAEKKLRNVRPSKSAACRLRGFDNFLLN